MALLIATVVLLSAASLYPFVLDVPGWRGNEIVRADGRWIFGDHNVAHTLESPDFIDAVRLRGALRIDLEIRSSISPQRGPARILTLARDERDALLTVAQMDDDLVVRLRRPGASDWGTPPFAIRNFFPAPTWREVVIQLKPDAIEITTRPAGQVPGIDGARQSLRADLPPHYSQDWPDGHILALGDAIAGGRPWQGEARRIAVDVGAGAIELLEPGMLEVPLERFYWPRRLRDRQSLLSDRPVIVALHLASFALLGYVLVVIGVGGAGARRVIVWALAFSILVQMAKVFFETRHPCLIDLPAQALGAWLGARVALARTSHSGANSDE